jgi:molybdate transport system ATP-binding protein
MSVATSGAPTAFPATPAIDVRVALAVAEGRRRFELDLGFTSQRGVVALYGPSGAGKTLTLHAIAGLVKPRGGHVRVAGHTLFDAATGVSLPPGRRRLGVLFQQYALFPHLDVRRNVAFGLARWPARPDAEAIRRVQALLEAFGLEALAESRPAALSGGQQQRVALARALAARPQALLLDEPFSALNPRLRRQLRAELAALLARERLPAVLITHDAEDVAALADTAVIVEGGRAVRQLDVAALRATPEALREALEAEEGAAIDERLPPLAAPRDDRAAVSIATGSETHER